MEIIVRGNHVGVPERFRQLATAKLTKLAKLDQKAMRIDVEVSKERNSRQSERRERVELTIRSRGPAIRAEAAAADRYTAFDLAFAKLETRLRRACDRRRKIRHAGAATVRSPEVLASVTAGAAAEVAGPDAMAAAAADAMAAEVQASGYPSSGPLDLADYPDGAGRVGRPRRAADEAGPSEADGHLIPIPMEGDGPLVVREKEHPAKPMTIEQALLEMELVGHDFYLFHDSDCGRFSVVYRRRGYDYGVIRLVEE